jgi:hypothetical protein
MGLAIGHRTRGAPGPTSDTGCSRRAVTTFLTASRARLRRATGGGRSLWPCGYAGSPRITRCASGVDQLGELGSRPGARRSPGGRLLAAPYTKRACGRGGLPNVRRPGIPARQYPPQRTTRTQRPVQDLAGRPPRARHPVTGKGHSPGRSLRSRRCRDGASRHPGV